jgi:hypothetical protein
MLIAVALGGSACASGSGGAARRARSCALAASDSIFAAAGPVFRDCAVDTKAQAVTPNAKIDFRPTRGGTNCYSAEAEFVVNSAGMPETKTARLVHATDRSFGEALLDAIANWRYKPAIKDGHPVRQIVDERRMMQTAVVVVPAGSAPPSRPPASAMPPSC